MNGGVVTIYDMQFSLPPKKNIKSRQKENVGRNPQFILEKKRRNSMRLCGKIGGNINTLILMHVAHKNQQVEARGASLVVWNDAEHLVFF